MGWAAGSCRRWTVGTAVVLLLLVVACDDNGFRPIADIDAPSCIGPADGAGHVYGTLHLRDGGMASFGDVKRATVSYSSGAYEVMLSSEHLILILHPGDNTSTLIAGNGDQYQGTLLMQLDCGIGAGRFEVTIEQPGLSGWYNTLDGTSGGW